MTPTPVGPCIPFATADDVQRCNACSDITDPVAEYWADVASRAAYKATGEQYGLCTATLRPCPASECGLWGLPWPLVPWSGDWWGAGRWWTPSWGVCGCSSRESCGCLGRKQIELGVTIRSVTEIKIDGVVFAPANYRVDENKWLVRLDGEVWPSAQDMAEPDTAVGTWSVDVSYGTAPSDLVVAGTAALACDLAKACTGGDCALTKNVVAEVRQNVQFQYTSIVDILAAGGTGCYLFDLMVGMENPDHLRRDGYAISVDDHIAARRVD